MELIIQAVEKIELKNIFQRLIKMDYSAIFNVFIAIIAILAIYLIIKMCSSVLEYDITPPTSPEKTLGQVAKDGTLNQKKDISLKKRYYLSPRKVELACECNLEFSSPAYI